jgi:amino acid adenylation domain-containing protein
VTAAAFLADLRTRDIHIRADGDRLIFDAPAGVLTPELRDRLRQCKDEILALLREPAELSFSQERMWFLDQLHPGAAAYVIAEAIEMRGALEVPLLERALHDLVGRHDALRTVFVNREGRPLQTPLAAAPWTLPVVDLTGDGAARERLAELLRIESSHGFNLAEGPLFRAHLYRCAPDVHVLLLTMHDIVSDGWSIGVLLRELGELYRACSRGEAVAPPPLRLQYRDFARWERDRLKGEALERLLAHWRSRLAGAPQVLDLPTDRPRPPVESYRGAIHSFTLPPDLVVELRALAQSTGATLFMALLSAFELLLARYSGQEDFVVGAPVANRDRPEFENLVGCFVNTVALRADVSGNPTVREFLARVREVCLDAYAHQDLPFERLVAELHPTRDASRNPLFQTMFVEQPSALKDLEIPGLALRQINVDKSTAQFDLTLEVQETADGLEGFFEYATDLFDEATIARMAAHWRTLLQGMVANPRARVQELPLLDAAERRQLLVEWSGAQSSLPVDALFHQIFEAHADRTPDAVAVVSGGRSLTYRELDRRANQLAHALRKRGVEPDVLVGLCVNRTPDMIVALLGILKAGGAFVPLDADYPAERLAFMLEDCRAQMLVTEEKLRAKLPTLPAGCQVLHLDGNARALGSEPEDAPHLQIAAESLAYAVYTSGSTGQPKAALLTHRGLANLAMCEKQLYGIRPDSRVLQFASLSFDASLSEIAMALCSGATLYVEARDVILPGPDLERYIRRTRISVFSLTPSALTMLDPAAVPSLETVIAGGEPCTAELAARWAGRCRFFNAYGPAEATVDSTYVEYRDGLAPPLIGRPLPNVRIYILDRALQPVPVGVAGELYIGGVGVARGYLNRPDLNAERFVPDPFSGALEARMYRSGDFARWRPNGHIEFIGRRDGQIKIRGFRIELGEIEAALQRHPLVQACATIVRKDTLGEPQLVGYVVPRGGDGPAVGTLREHLRRSLPEYMVPATFVFLDALPLTPSDKVDRKALPDPSVSGTASARGAYVAPRNDLEISLATAWKKVLGVPRVGITDNFFDLGGNSLSVIRLAFEMKQATGMEIDLGELFRSPTIAEVVTSLGPDAVRNTSVVVPLQPEGDGLPVFCICGINIYRAFAESLGEDQPVYGVYVAEEQAIVDQVIRGETPEVSIDQLVDAYYEAIRRFRPLGPYRLAGLSFGGILAMELASRMRKGGAEVELVFLLDAILPQAIRYNWRKWISRQATDVLKGNGLKKLRRLVNELPAKFAKRRPTPSGQRKFFDALLANGQDVLFSRASIKWQEHHSDYDFKAILFRASDLSLPAHLDVDDDYGWRRYLGERLSIVDAVGGHRGIIEPPNVTELGRIVRRYLGLTTQI